jgi:Family of unknown function (DUF6527)
MSDAKVEFMTIEGNPCPADQKPARFTFRCVNGNRGRHPLLRTCKCANLLIAEGPYSAAHGVKRDGQGLNGGRPQWDWDGNRETPTFSPSINCESDCGWHGYIRNGRTVSCASQDEPE